MTARGLKALLLRNPRLALRYRTPRICDLFDRGVLGGVLELMAVSAIFGVYAPDPEADGCEPILAQLARHLDMLGCEDRVLNSLFRLVAAEFLVVLSNQSIAMSIVVGAAPRGVSSSNGCQSVGRRRKHETPEAYAARTAEHQANLRAQGEMKLAVTGGRELDQPVSGNELAAVLRAAFKVVGGTDAVAAEATATAPEAVVQVSSQVSAQVMSQVSSQVIPEVSPEISPPVVVGVVDSLDSESKTPPPPVLTPRDAAENLNPNPPRNLDEPPEPEMHPADELAALAVSRFSWHGYQARRAPAMFRRILDGTGHSPDQLRSQILQAEGVNGPKWFEKALARIQPARTAAAAGMPSRFVPAAAGLKLATPPADDPRILAEADWENLPYGAKEQMGRILRLMDRPAGEDRAQALGEAKIWHRENFDRVAAKHPALAAMEAATVEVPLRRQA